MRKLIVLFVVVIVSLSCSSDNNEVNESEIVDGISTSTKIQTPKWLQGNWRISGGGTSPFVPGFSISSNELCFISLTTECFQEMINQAYRTNPDVVKVEQEYREGLQQGYREGYYRLSIYLNTTTIESIFTEKSNSEVRYTMGNVKGTLFKVNE
ncbi:hypothetical protein HX057_11830 [Myroides odoratimimus]|uniref:hypothetical protein n=1 Tax=Myroides odoratimimus TaxID=76832 RepID=UPI002576D9DC|nr:hypothetical protein [Myroides odoratimimus]MDM1447440.1 hypothetical protein [Myroides odoratimimus]